jgi:hypothetical protein
MKKVLIRPLPALQVQLPAPSQPQDPHSRGGGGTHEEAGADLDELPAMDAPNGKLWPRRFSS